MSDDFLSPGPFFRHQIAGILIVILWGTFFGPTNNAREWIWISRGEHNNKDAPFIFDIIVKNVSIINL